MGSIRTQLCKPQRRSCIGENERCDRRSLGARYDSRADACYSPARRCAHQIFRRTISLRENRGTSIRSSMRSRVSHWYASDPHRQSRACDRACHQACVTRPSDRAPGRPGLARKNQQTARSRHTGILSLRRSAWHDRSGRNHWSFRWTSARNAMWSRASRCRAQPRPRSRRRRPIGEIELRENDFAGLTIHIAESIASKAHTGETLVSGVVADLVAGSGLHFQEHGSQTIDGMPGELRLLAVTDVQHLEPAQTPRTASLDVLSAQARSSDPGRGWTEQCWHRRKIESKRSHDQKTRRQHTTQTRSANARCGSGINRPHKPARRTIARTGHRKLAHLGEVSLNPSILL